MVSGNHWSCVHINLETGDGLYTDSVRPEIPRDFEDTFGNFFSSNTRSIRKNTMTLLNPCKLLMKFNQQKGRSNADIFV